MNDKANNASHKQNIIDVALRLAAVEGWEHLSVRHIADTAEIPLADFYDHFDDKTDIVVAYGRALDREVMQAFPKFHPETSHRERLFDILMERFDKVNEHRAALLSILNSMKFDPKQMIISLPHLGHSMQRMLELADIDTGGARGALRVMGLLGVYVWALRAWVDDETKDLSKTMAALDRALDRADSLSQNFNL